jgi:sorting nexin-1/2
MMDDVPPIVGTMTITISDPIKNDQGMVNSYISYKVNTETTMEGFECEQFSVIRRYSDFVWLRGALLNGLPGVIIPPLPEKAVMNRFSPEFVEGRRRALERFATRCGEHAHIREAEVFKMFLSADDDKLTKSKAEVKKAQSSGSSGGWLSSLPGTASAQEKFRSEEDKKMDEVTAYVTNLEAQMKNVAKHTATLTKRGKELSQGLFDFGLAFTMLGQHETAALNSALSQMGHTADQLSLIAADQVEKEQRSFEEPIGDYIQLLQAVKEALERRAVLRKSYFAAVGDMESKQATVAHYEATISTPSSEFRLPEAKVALTAAQEVELKMKQELEMVTGRLLGEVNRFKRAKADDMRKVVLDYVQLQIEYNKQMEQQWADLVPEVERIQVESVSSVNIFDGALPPSPAVAPSQAAADN